MDTAQEVQPIETDSLRNLVILGAGGFAREVAWLVADINRTQRKTWSLIGFWERGTERVGYYINGVPVVSLDDVQQYLPNLYAVVAIGNPKARERAVREAEHAGCRFATLIHPAVQYDRSTVTIGPRSIICAGSILTVNITLGQCVQINLDCTVGHDVVMGDFTTLAPGVHVSGCVHLGKRVYVGTGAVIIDGTQEEPIVIGDDVVVGAGACVTKSVPAGLVVVGIPARPLENR